MDFTSLLHTLGIWVVVAPSVLLTVLGLTTLVSRPLSERSAIRCMQASVMIGLACAVAVLIIMLATGIREVPISIGKWKLGIDRGRTLPFSRQVRFRPLVRSVCNLDVRVVRNDWSVYQSILASRERIWAILRLLRLLLTGNDHLGIGWHD